MTYSSPRHPFTPSSDRALQAARERATVLLTDRFADESLSEAEFEARLYWLSNAGTAARVDELVADLAVARHPGAAMGPQHGFAAGPPHEERLLALMSSTTRSGHWTLPPRLRARAVMSELLLDLRYASMPPAAEIDLVTIMANVRIIVPPEVEVECAVSPIMGTVRNGTGRIAWPGQTRPRLRVTGTCFMAELRIDVAPRQVGW
ncbi:MAG: hypothetical protein JWL60_1722 [Gemmatimonadetes bacterium]|jgi:hypothetical protein|nr:hypothetical protein [Gemmatimonadota bacterium]